MKKTLMALSVLGFLLSTTGAQAHEERRAPLAVTISYKSQGAGIEEAVKTRIDAAIHSLAEAGAVAYMTSVPRGREGETEVCVEFKELTSVRPAFAEFESLSKKGRGQTTVSLGLSCRRIVPANNE